MIVPLVLQSLLFILLRYRQVPYFTSRNSSSLSVFERGILRKIFGPTKKANGIWRIKTNKELDELIKHRNIINYVKAQQLSWFWTRK